MTKHSEIIATMMGLLYPVIILFGIYVILNGHLSPGGGFQGGAILASVLISRYLVHPTEDLRIGMLQTLEKVLFLGIIGLPALLVLGSEVLLPASLNEPYLMAMNGLIGLKVASGLGIIFFRFVFYEGGRV